MKVIVINYSATKKVSSENRSDLENKQTQFICSLPEDGQFGPEILRVSDHTHLRPHPPWWTWWGPLVQQSLLVCWGTWTLWGWSQWPLWCSPGSAPHDPTPPQHSWLSWGERIPYSPSSRGGCGVKGRAGTSQYVQTCTNNTEHTHNYIDSNQITVTVSYVVYIS